ncbi:hypothetical protein [Nitrospirillum amazonense]|uniref:hypothetical protein n=1 Tax=Nitrospirillum amazonense TaxID=28077 RepID=UPI0011A85117|nr:hypothetical protein [Nitrospirillum amazonense]
MVDGATVALPEFSPPADGAEPPMPQVDVLAALHQKLLRDLEAAILIVRQKEAEIESVERALQIIAPGTDRAVLHPRRTFVPGHEILTPGEARADVLRVLQESRCRLTTVEILETLLRERGALNLAPERRGRTLRNVHGILSEAARNGIVQRRGKTQHRGPGCTPTVYWFWVGPVAPA